MPDNFFTGILYGPQGPETRRIGDDRWGKYLECAFEGKDDEGFVEKTSIMGKHTFFLGTMWAIADVCLLNNRGGLPTALQRMKFHYVPWLGGTVAYTATVSTVCGLRGGKTDQWNHAAGGFAVGSIIGKLSRSFIIGLVSGSFLSVMGWYYKDSRMNNYELFPAVWEKPGKSGHAFTHKWDFTTNWNAPRRGYWVRTPEESAEVYKSGQYGDNEVKRIW
ncbi:hypothetical protein Ocin01_06315 [Orchesella cincta]|uniref:NADH dehydrogenase [ubiquinone] 1 alpha subcomplex subunit 11 n=1 Tax=Orchesella cincta TaxID=48709 RepID=A0A1D2N524_ORCCI|nr:hypothetical protein Ocin01_06315 [Orchesella cincta]